MFVEGSTDSRTVRAGSYSLPPKKAGPLKPSTLRSGFGPTPLRLCGVGGSRPRPWRHLPAGAAKAARLQHQHRGQRSAEVGEVGEVGVGVPGAGGPEGEGPNWAKGKLGIDLGGWSVLGSPNCLSPVSRFWGSRLCRLWCRVSRVRIQPTAWNLQRRVYPLVVDRMPF